MEPATSSAPDREPGVEVGWPSAGEEEADMGPNPTERYDWGYAGVANNVEAMTPYEDLATPAEMHADCEAVSRRLARAARAATRPAPSIHFADYPREVPKRDVEISAAAARIAGALHLHLD